MSHIFVFDGLDKFSQELETYGIKVDKTFLDMSPVFDAHEEYEKWAEAQDFNNIVNSVDDKEVYIVLKPTVMSGALLVFIEALKMAQKNVSVCVLGRMKTAPTTEKFLFRVLYGILKEKAVCSAISHFFVFSYDLLLKYLKVSLMEQDDKFQSVIAELLFRKLQFLQMRAKNSFSSDFKVGADAIQRIKDFSKVSILSKVPIQNITQFQKDLEEIVLMFAPTCEILQNNLYVSDPGAKMSEKIEEFIYGENVKTNNNVFIFSESKESYLLETFVY